MPKATTIKPQSYDVFIYKSTGAQTGNRFNSWSDLMTAIARQEGAKTIYFEQDETIPAGSWNLDYVTLRGNGQEYNAGGYTLTFGDNTTISSWLVPGVHSLLLKSTSTTGHICTFTSAFSITFQVVSNIQSSSSYEFFSSSASGQNIIALRDSGRFSLVGGSTKELFKFTGSAFSQQVIVSLGDGAVITDNTLSSTNAVIHIPIIGSVNQALGNWIPSHTNLSVGAEVPLNLTNSQALLNTAAGNIAATNVQDAINELDTEKVAKAGDTMTGTLVLDDGTTTTEPLQFVDGALLTTPATGAMEFDANTLYFTPDIDRRSVNLADGIITSDTTVSNTVTETTIFTEPISANELHTGQLVKTRILGRYSTANGADTFTARLKVGGTTVDTLTSTAANVTNKGIDIEFTFTVRTTGATGTVWGHATGIFNNEVKSDASTATTTIDTTAADDITLTIQWSNALSGNTITISQGYTEFIN